MHTNSRSALAVTGEQSDGVIRQTQRTPQPPSQIKNIDLHDSPSGTKRYLTLMRRQIDRTSASMESLASRTNVASLRTGSATRPASHLNRGRAAPVAVRAQGANDDGNEANKTSSAVAGAWQKKTETPNPDPGPRPRAGRIATGDGARRSSPRRPAAPRTHPASSRASRPRFSPTPAPNRFG